MDTGSGYEVVRLKDSRSSHAGSAEEGRDKIGFLAQCAEGEDELKEEEDAPWDLYPFLGDGMVRRASSVMRVFVQLAAGSSHSIAAGKAPVTSSKVLFSGKPRRLCPTGRRSHVHSIGEAELAKTPTLPVPMTEGECATQLPGACACHRTHMGASATWVVMLGGYRLAL